MGRDDLWELAGSSRLTADCREERKCMQGHIQQRIHSQQIQGKVGDTGKKRSPSPPFAGTLTNKSGTTTPVQQHPTSLSPMCTMYSKGSLDAFVGTELHVDKGSSHLIRS